MTERVMPPLSAVADLDDRPSPTRKPLSSKAETTPAAMTSASALSQTRLARDPRPLWAAEPCAHANMPRTSRIR